MKNHSYRREDGVEETSMNLFLNSIQLFYNRKLFSRLETFFSMSKIKTKGNASAEATFDAKMEQLKKQTRGKFKELLDSSSQMNLCANIRSIEVIVPDQQNYATSKFLVAQVGGMVLDNKAEREEHGN
jgi:hypothetical protein